MTTPKQEFHSIRIKRDAQEKIYDAIKEMTPEEEVAYFQQSIEGSKFSKWWQSASSRTKVSEMR